MAPFRRQVMERIVVAIRTSRRRPRRCIENMSAGGITVLRDRAQARSSASSSAACSRMLGGLLGVALFKKKDLPPPGTVEVLPTASKVFPPKHRKAPAAKVCSSGAPRRARRSSPASACQSSTYVQFIIEPLARGRLPLGGVGARLGPGSRGAAACDATRWGVSRPDSGARSAPSPTASWPTRDEPRRDVSSSGSRRAAAADRLVRQTHADSGRAVSPRARHCRSAWRWTRRSRARSSASSETSRCVRRSGRCWRPTAWRTTSMEPSSASFHSAPKPESSISTS